MAVSYLENQPSNTQLTLFSLTWKLTSPFFQKNMHVSLDVSTKPGLPARVHTQSSKHGSCPILPNGFRKGKMLGRMLGIMLHRKKRFLERRFFFIKISS